MSNTHNIVVYPTLEPHMYTDKDKYNKNISDISLLLLLLHATLTLSLPSRR